MGAIITYKRHRCSKYFRAEDDQLVSQNLRRCLPHCYHQTQRQKRIMTLLDHIFVLVFAVMYPIAGFIGFRRLLRKIAAGMPVNRNHLYLNTITWHWILFALALIAWADSGRPWGVLGFNFEMNVRFLIAAALTIASIAFLVAQVRRVASAPQQDLDRVKSGFGALFLLVPRNGSELARFNVLSVTAGIVEETLWRGFLIWYLGQFMPVWAAAIISAIGFGVAHGYQGLANIPRVTLVGAVFASLFVLTGSLWLPIILHAAVDLLQGRLAYDVLRRIGTEDCDVEDSHVQTSC
jgi:membrane protease YdiL (CAAX protease family)